MGRSPFSSLFHRGHKVLSLLERERCRLDILHTDRGRALSEPSTWFISKDSKAFVFDGCSDAEAVRSSLKELFKEPFLCEVSCHLERHKHLGPSDTCGSIPLSGRIIRGFGSRCFEVLKSLEVQVFGWTDGKLKVDTPIPSSAQHQSTHIHSYAFSHIITVFLKNINRVCHKYLTNRSLIDLT